MNIERLREYNAAYYHTHLSRSLRYINDPGHGWLEVPKADLERLGLTDTISGYSYESGDFVYLEEDCDMPKYLADARSAGMIVQIIVKYESATNIRSMSSYKRGA